MIENLNKEKFIIIDGPAVLHRAWHALPKLTDKKGQVVNAVYGFTRVLLKLLREIKPQYIAVAFDTKAPTFRHQEYKEYKATRVPQPQEFYDQIPITKKILSAFNIPIFEKDGYEADDLIGMLSQKTKTENFIVTGDLDMLQLVDKKTKVYFLRKGISDTFIYGKEEVKERYGLTPQQLIDFKALRGDPSDNIPGVPGIGAKTALKLIKKFGSLESLYQEITKDKEIKESLKNLLIEHKEQAFLGKKLVTILEQVPTHFNLDNCRIKEINKEKIKELFEELDFKSLIKELDEKKSSSQKSLF